MSATPHPSSRAFSMPRPASLRRTEVAVPALAAAILLEALREIWLGSGISATPELQAQLSLVAVVQAVGVVALRRAPLLGVVLACSAPISGSLLGDLWERAPIIGLGVIPACYLLGRWTAGRTQAAGTVLAGALAVGAVVAEVLLDRIGGEFTAGGFVSRLAFTFAMIWVGIVVRDRATLHAALRARAERHEQERERAREQTVLDERARIAGELHDVIAHALSAIVVQAGAARQLAETDERATAEALTAVETTGRGAMAEIRSMLSVLREPDGAADGALATWPTGRDGDLAPQPGVDRLPHLAAQAPGGLDVALEVRGEPRPLAASVDLTAYRVAQEAIRAADAAGATRAILALAYERTALVLTVTDDGARGTRAPLLTRERAQLYGGELTAAPAREGFVVRARLPLDEPAR